MGKTYEALEQAEKEFRDAGMESPVRLPYKTLRKTPSRRRIIFRTPLEEYESLKSNLLTRTHDEPIQAILFTGTTHEGGCSTTSVFFATALAKDSQMKVLLVDVNLRTPSLHDIFKLDCKTGLSDLPVNCDITDPEFRKVGPGNMYVLPWGGQVFGPAAYFGSEKFDLFLKNMRSQFDYVILDGSPVTGFSESRVISSKVDGVILVLEAGRTRSHVAIRAKKEIEEAGGRLLGVVLNKRKFYIPEWIYRRL